MNKNQVANWNSAKKRDKWANQKAIYDGVIWGLFDRLNEIKKMISGYSDQWKIDNWDQWKVIRSRYYQEKEKFYKENKWYIKSFVSNQSQGNIDYVDVTDEMAEIQIRKLILQDYVEEKREPVHTGKYTRWQRKRFA